MTQRPTWVYVCFIGEVSVFPDLSLNAWLGDGPSTRHIGTSQPSSPRWSSWYPCNLLASRVRGSDPGVSELSWNNSVFSSLRSWGKSYMDHGRNDASWLQALFARFIVQTLAFRIPTVHARPLLGGPSSLIAPWITGMR